MDIHSRTASRADRHSFGLTEKQVEVLDLLADHHSTKQIARILRISPSAVDQRIYSAGDRLGESDRRKLARKYASMRTACEKPTGEFSQLQSADFPVQPPLQDADARGIFTFRDATSFASFAPWDEDVRLPLLEKLDARIGLWGRLFMIAALAAVVAMLFLATFVIARTLGGMI